MMAYSIVEEIESHKGLLTVNDMARIFDVSSNVIYKAIDDGKIPTLIVPFGGKRFDPKTILFWIRKQNPILNLVQRSS